MSNGIISVAAIAVEGIALKFEPSQGQTLNLSVTFDISIYLLFVSRCSYIQSIVSLSFLPRVHVTLVTWTRSYVVILKHSDL